MTERLRGIAHGRVQGVFFRVTVQDLARSLALSGTVRNMADGTVEIVVYGPRERLEMLIVELEQTPPPASVTHIDCEWSQTEESPAGFNVI